MSFLYFDANVSVKCYVNEIGSTWVRNLFDEKETNARYKNVVFTAEITIVETAAALSVIERIGRVNKKVRDSAFNMFLNDIATRYRIIPITSSLLLKAAFLTQKYPLKGYDAVQLAAALNLFEALKKQNRRMIFISGDKQLLHAAVA